MFGSGLSYARTDFHLHTNKDKEFQYPGEQNTNDIILIDQQEDDLDNKVIYDEVIKAISQKKTCCQFVFATHNANIPVLEDSERVLVTEYQDTRIDISQGNINLADTHKQIVEIMEGGQDAFEKTPAHL